MMKFLYIAALVFLKSYLFAQSDYTKAEELSKKGNYTQAIPLYEKHLKATPNDEKGLRKLGKSYIENGAYQKGILSYQKALNVNPSCGSCYLNIAIAFARQGTPDSMLVYVDKAKAADPNGPNVYIVSAEYKLLKGQSLGALMDYDKAVQLDTTTNALLQRANYYQDRNKPSSALVDVLNALKRDSLNADIQFRAGHAFIDVKHYPEALSHINKAIALDSNKSHYYSQRAFLYDKLKDTTKMLLNYNKAISLPKPDDYAWLQLQQYYYKQEKLDSSCFCLTQALKIYKAKRNDQRKEEVKAIFQHHCDSNLSSYYYQRGIACYNLNLTQQSLEWHRKAVKKFPQNVLIYHFIGNTYMKIGDWAKAAEAYQKLLNNPGQIATDLKEMQDIDITEYKNMYYYASRFSLGQSYLYLGAYEKAVNAFDEALQYDFNAHKITLYEARNLKGVAHMQLKQYDKALEAYNLCLRSVPDYAFAYKNRAILRLLRAELITYRITNVFLRDSKSQTEIQFSAEKFKNKSTHYESALEDIESCLKFSKDDPEAYYIRGIIKYNLGFPDYCYDFILAKSKGYVFENELDAKCK